MQNKCSHVDWMHTAQSRHVLIRISLDCGPMAHVVYVSLVMKIVVVSTIAENSEVGL